MSQPIYLDYNATTPIDSEVAAEMKRIIDSVFGNPSSAYTFGHVAKQVVENARAQVAALINAHPNEIVFTSCATESNNLAIRGALKAQKGRHIITSAIEHPAVIEVCRHLEVEGCTVSYLPVNSHGMVSPTDVEAAIRPDTALISIMHANNETGSIQPIGKIGTIARKHNIIFHTDASQSAGKIAIDVNRTGVDLLTLAGHKIYAPKGIGALYVREGVKIENILYGAGQEGGLRPGTENVVHIAAMGKACEVALRDFDKNTDNMRHTRGLLLQGLNKLYPGKTTLHADLEQCLPNTLSVAIKGVDAHALTTQLADKVMFSTGSACHAGQVNISTVLKAMGVDAQTSASTLRLSTGKHTTHNEIKAALKFFEKTIVDMKIVDYS